MPDLLFGDFALMTGPATEGKQFRLPDNFSKAYFTFLSRLCEPASGLRAVLRVFTTRMDRCREIQRTMQLLTQMRSREIQPEFSFSQVEFAAH